MTTHDAIQAVADVAVQRDHLLEEVNALKDRIADLEHERSDAWAEIEQLGIELEKARKAAGRDA